MMLQALIAYADREKLGDPDFKKMPVRWEIALDGRGSSLSFRVLKIQTRRRSNQGKWFVHLRERRHWSREGPLFV